jgi:putative two-component system response regulator
MNDKYLQQNNSDLKNQTMQEFGMISSIINCKSVDLAQHSREVSQIANIILSNIDKTKIVMDNFSRKMLNFFDVETLSLIYEYHDIGKAFIDESILNSDSKLSDEEYKVIQNHVFAGLDIVTNIYKGKVSKTQEYENIYTTLVNIIKYHHENVDGSGYPFGFKGEQISFLGKIARVVDVISALMGTRVYKKSWPAIDTLNYLHKHVGQFFDPFVVEIVKSNWDKIIQVFLNDKNKDVYNLLNKFKKTK